MRRFRFLSAALAALLVVSTAAPAGAELRFSKSFSYFSVGGTTAAELDGALSREGPLMKSTGARHPGATRIKFGGSVTYVSRGGKCAVGKAVVTLNTRIILPRWVNRKRANPDLALVWDTLSADIKRHEERHAEIARNYARTLESTLQNLRPQTDCTEMQALVARESEKAVAEHDKDQARFDRSEAINFDRRMIRLLQYRLDTIKRQQAQQ